MALITNLPNFATESAPSASLFNQAIRKIADQTGGVAPGIAGDPGNPLYVELNGNLDSNNVSATAGLRNIQKAEPYSLIGATTIGKQVGGSFPFLIYFGPFGCDLEIDVIIIARLFEDFLVPGNNFIVQPDASARGGQISQIQLYVNGGFAGSIPPTNIPTLARFREPGVFNVGLTLRIGDVLAIDARTKLSFSAAPNNDITVSIYGKAKHVK